MDEDKSPRFLGKVLLVLVDLSLQEASGLFLESMEMFWYIGGFFVKIDSYAIAHCPVQTGVMSNSMGLILDARGSPSLF